MSTIEELRVRLKEAEDALSAAQEREDRLLGETVDLQSEIRAKTLIADELKADMKRADTKYAELKTSNDRVALELEAEKASAAAMRLELRLSESRLNDAQREAREARSQLDEVRSSADGATKATAEAVAQASQREQELQARIQALETEAVELRAQAESLTAEKQLFEQQYAQFQDEFEKHHEEHQTLLVAHRALGKEKEALEAELEQWPAKVEAAKVSAQDETKRVMELAEQERQQAIVREAQHQQQVQVEMQQTQHEFALTRAALQQSTQQHQALQLVTQQLQAQLQTVNAHVDKEREKCSRLEAQIQQLQAQKSGNEAPETVKSDAITAASVFKLPEAAEPSNTNNSAALSSAMTQMAELKRMLSDERQQLQEERSRTQKLQSEVQSLRQKLETSSSAHNQKSASNSGPRPYYNPISGPITFPASHPLGSKNRVDDGDDEFADLRSDEFKSGGRPSAVERAQLAASVKLGIELTDSGQTEPDFDMQCDLFEVYLKEAALQVQQLQKACLRLVSLDPVTFAALSQNRMALHSGKITPKALPLPQAPPPQAIKDSSRVRFDDNKYTDQDEVENQSGSDDEPSGKLKSALKPSKRVQPSPPAGWGTTDPFADARQTSLDPSLLPNSISSGNSMVTLSHATGQRHLHQEALDLCLAQFTAVQHELARAHAMMSDHLNRVIRVHGSRVPSGKGSLFQSLFSCCYKPTGYRPVTNSSSW